MTLSISCRVCCSCCVGRRIGSLIVAKDDDVTVMRADGAVERGVGDAAGVGLGGYVDRYMALVI